ncbi:hypothetical protein [Paenibacillus riograndensis]|uniref:hypothetical protein n=1 Tax=Paenibacillus riograndensis TaxID=483937 RepID=UPI000A6C3C5B|nr:hypothetical protein [Paenibacillus riograndensis]
MRPGDENPGVGSLEHSLRELPLRNQPLAGCIPPGTSTGSLLSGRLFVCPGDENPQAGSLEHSLREDPLRNQP